MKKYNFKAIEKKWQKFWEQNKSFAAQDSGKDKFYALVEFPYPSGDGLHVGHVRSYTAIDTVARYQRMLGKNVLYPIGWDAFGLPTENFAIKNKIHPRVATDRNVKNFKRQMKSLGLSFDWNREIDTTDPKYYKWTQWIFLQLYKAGMAYRDEIAINWCPKCKTGLANEEVVNGKHERCGTEVTKKFLKQWLVRITKYADRLIKDLDKVDFPERVKSQQINWIGRSEGAEIEFSLKGISGQADGKHFLKAFTTRPDTIFGVTYIAVSPELAQRWIDVGWQATGEVKKYVAKSLARSELDRQDESKEKTGVDTGIKAVNPINGEEVPVWVADYVLGSYGTGAVMAVPAHDQRDFEFAKKFGLPIKQVIAPETGVTRNDEQRRDGGCAIIFDPGTQKYAVYKDEGGRLGLFAGGFDEGEEEEAAIAREVTEESGLYDFKKVEKVGTTFAHFYNPRRKVNRKGLASCHLIILNSKKTKPVSHEAHESFNLQWVSADDIKNNWDKLKDGGNVDQWIWFLPKAVGRAIELGLDKTSSKKAFTDQAFTEQGIMIASGKFDELRSKDGAGKVVQELVKMKKGKAAISYKLRDWVFSRQHYWGEPIPIVYCEKCGEVPVPEKDLPVELPKVKNYEPTDTGQSPLAVIKKFVETSCPKCSGPARRETDTMPNWAGSNWYFLRYIDPKNDKAFAEPKKIDYWMPVDLYNGGMEHTTLHLLYSRFIYKFLFDQGFVPAPEPYARRTSHGIILAEDGRKMSKSFGNVINPDEIVDEYGADALRLYEMFLAPFDQMVPWDSRGVIGVKRFLERFYKLLQSDFSDSQTEEEKKFINRLIAKITSDIESMKFNTAISSFMEALNQVEKMDQFSKKTMISFVILLAPFAPHMAEEAWEMLGSSKSVGKQPWPTVEKKYLVDDRLKIVVQVNGRVRDTLEIDADLPEEQVVELAQKSEKVIAHLKGKRVVKKIYIPGKILNFVIS